MRVRARWLLDIEEVRPALAESSPEVNGPGSMVSGWCISECYDKTAGTYHKRG